MYNKTPASQHPDTTGSPPAGFSGHIPALDGLRGLAILLVLTWHYIEPSHRWFPGWTGVDLFFVLSGYLITGRLLATKQLPPTKHQPGYFSRFYRNRALRIFPLYYGVIIVFFAVLHLLQAGNLPPFTLYLDHWKSFFIFTQNWTFIIHGTPRDLSLVHLWSLAVEEQCYLVWPLLILWLAADRTTGIRFFITAILLVLSIRCISYFLDPASAEAHYYNTFFRMDSLMTGSLLCLLHAHTKKSSPAIYPPISGNHSIGVRPPAGSNLSTNAALPTGGSLPTGKEFRISAGVHWLLIALFVAGPLVAGNAYPFNPFFATIGYTVTALLFACLLDKTLRPDNGALSRFFSSAWLRFLGKISYGLYLVHFPILVFLRPRIYHWARFHWPDYPQPEFVISECICLLLSVLFSVISYRYFETRFLRLKK